MTAPERLQNGPLVWSLGDRDAPKGPHVALVPGVQAPLLALDLPDKLRGMARERVAERQLTEALSMPANGLEIRPFLPKGTKDFRSAMVVESGLAEAWRKSLKPGCSAVLPDYLALPAADGLWTVNVKDDSVRVRIGITDGFTAEPELALAMLAEAKIPRAILRIGEDQAEIDAFLGALDVPTVSDVKKLRKEGLTPLRWADAAGGIDLKTPPSAAFDALRTRLLRWRAPVVFGVLALAMWMISLVLETRDWRAQAERDQQIALDLVRQHFVPSGPILDIRVQVASALEQLKEPEIIEIETLPPLAQLQLAAPYMTADNLRLTSTSYREDTGLVTTIEATDFAGLDAFIARLQEADFLVEQLDSRAQQSGGVVARLRVEFLQ